MAWFRVRQLINFGAALLAIYITCNNEFTACFNLTYTKQVENSLIKKCDFYDIPVKAQLNEFKEGQKKLNELTFKTNHNYSLEVDFKARVDAQKLRLQTILLVNNKSIRLPFFRRKNFCGSTNSLQCPIHRNDNCTFRLNVRIPEHSPSLNAHLKMQLMSEKKQKLFCIIIPLNVE